MALELAGNDTLLYVAFEDGLVRFIELLTGNIVFEMKDLNIGKGNERKKLIYI